jgi:hypothetical protein
MTFAAKYPTLPARARAGLGYIYVIAFSNWDNTVKVGSTADPRGRFNSHRASGEPFGIDISDWWFSPAHLQCGTTEQTLVRLVEKLGGRKIRNEYFTGVSFQRVVELAKSMDIREVTAREAHEVALQARRDSRRREVQHFTEEQISAQVGLRYTAEHFGLTQERAAEIISADPQGEIALWCGDMVEAVRLSRRAWLRGNRQTAA